MPTPISLPKNMYEQFKNKESFNEDDIVLYRELLGHTSQDVDKKKKQNKMECKIVNDLSHKVEECEQNSKIVSKPILKDKVVCKMFLTGKPQTLNSTIGNILSSLNSYSNGRVDNIRTKNYALTLLIEEI